MQERHASTWNNVQRIKMKAHTQVYSPEGDTLVLYLYGVRNWVSVVVVEGGAWEQWKIHRDTFGCTAEGGGVLPFRGEGQHSEGVSTCEPLFRLRGQGVRMITVTYDKGNHYLYFYSFIYKNWTWNTHLQ